MHTRLENVCEVEKLSSWKCHLTFFWQRVGTELAKLSPTLSSQNFGECPPGKGVLAEDFFWVGVAVH